MVPTYSRPQSRPRLRTAGMCTEAARGRFQNRLLGEQCVPAMQGWEAICMETAAAWEGPRDLCLLT